MKSWCRCPFEGREFGTADVFEYQFGFYVGDLLARGERGHRQVSQMVGVARPDMDQEVDRPGHVIQLNDFGQAERMLPESIDIRLEMAYQPDSDHGLDAVTQAGWRDLGVKPADHAVFLQQANTDQAGRSRQADLAGNLLVGNSCIILQQGQNFVVDSIQRLFHYNIPNIIRRCNFSINFIL